MGQNVKLFIPYRHASPTSDTRSLAHTQLRRFNRSLAQSSHPVMPNLRTTQYAVQGSTMKPQRTAPFVSADTDPLPGPAAKILQYVRACEHQATSPAERLRKLFGHERSPTVTERDPARLWTAQTLGLLQPHPAATTSISTSQSSCKVPTTTAVVGMRRVPSALTRAF